MSNNVILTTEFEIVTFVKHKPVRNFQLLRHMNERLPYPQP